jgi:hypothetical protein
VAQQEEKASAVEIIGQIYDMVDGWLAKLSSEQERRLREAADRLYSVASEIDQENWQRNGHA